MTLEKEIEDFYANDPQLGDMVFLKNNFDDTTIRGEVVGIERTQPNRGLSPDRSYEVVMYTGLYLKIGGIDLWLDFEEWTVTDILRGAEYKKLPPEVVKPEIDEN